MARVEVVMPKMGESIMEGTVIEWSKSIGDTIEQDETLLEIATDKVDSEVPSPASGVLVEILAEVNDTIEVGNVIAIIETDASAAGDAGSAKEEAPAKDEAPAEEEEPTAAAEDNEDASDDKPSANVEGDTPPQREGSDGRFYSPLVRSIAKEEGVSMEELESIEGSGAQGRVNKQDVLDYLNKKKSSKSEAPKLSKPVDKPAAQPSSSSSPSAGDRISAGEIKVNWPSENVEIIKMDRMRKLIADHMVKSKQTSAHVTTFAEADVTNLVNFREKNKGRFQQENGFKLTFTPFIIEATIQALREYPLMNSSVDGENIVLKRDINYGIAVSLGESGSGGLIVPVIKNAGEMNLHGLARATNDLARKARSKQLSPDDLVGGTFTLTNYGSVGNLMGTPIINQPQVAIFGTGAIKKRPVVMETEIGDVIAVRHMLYLSMSYDHRIIDGALGGAFVQRVVQLLESFDPNRTI
ncbi:MAG: 2-oxoglutarate dehydrogenase, E2 component, dihydrolipoamide succinyltransferase [Bacteroidetes bacterium]|nr:2-oxoglutarate dehydrogenase, E2 component, dihydrolipoamide succinyltransferase [Bacteroidota bacterium]MCH8525359.1 2-oxoglutarate dehydrogenase, E2 component, dihydrolipoamide succinyltransferase [Balneolales bacterium]